MLGRRLPRLHLVTDDAVLARADFADLAATALVAGGAAVALHLRSARATGARLYALAAELAAVAARAGGAVLVNDRVDVALAARCAGVQLGGGAMAIADARSLLGAGRLVGASVHSPEEAGARVAEGADFLVAGAVYETPSHPGRAGAGTAWLAGIAALGAPVIAIGGITHARVAEVVRAGAHGVAVVSGVWSAASPALALHHYLDALGAA